MPGCEDPSGDDVALNFREPQLHLVEPGRVGRREMYLYIRMLAQKRLHGFGLVCREIVEDHVDVLLARLMGHEVGEKGNALGRGMPVSGAPEHVPVRVLNAA